MKPEIIQADYQNPRHAQDLRLLLDSYARDPMGGGAPLPAAVLEQVVAELAKRAHAFSVLAYVEGRAAGLANCFEGFSTFQARPIVNIHDMVVQPEFRGCGVGQALLGRVEEIALGRGCCKLTLEVLGGNGRAQAAYRRFGFEGYALDPQVGQAHFWQKTLPAA